MLKSHNSAGDDGGLSQLLAETRELVRQAKQVLRDPPPDTSLGRRMQRPISSDERDEQ